MEILDATTVFWLMALGMVVGGTMKLAWGRRGLGLLPNVIGGAAGSVIVGSIGIALQIPGSMLFAFMGCIAILFLANVFNVLPEEGH